jgi:hypothetical protein
MAKSLYLLLIAALAASGCRSRQETADVVYMHGKIWTGDSTRPWVSVLAVRGDSIVYAGDDDDQWKAQQVTRIIRLDGALVVPGFIDNHVHFLSGGFYLAGINLRSAASKKDFIGMVREWVASLPDSTSWITGGNWDHEAWGGELPDRSWIDSVSGNHPIMLTRYDGHMALCNSLALSKANITRLTRIPAGGEMGIRKETGELSGILKDEAMALMDRFIPLPGPGQMDLALDSAARHALAHGITRVFDMGSFGGWPDLETYQRNRQANKLPVRIHSFVPIQTWEKLAAYVTQKGNGDSRLWWGGIKAFVDGSLGSTTAWFYEPYLDKSGYTGTPVTDTGLLRKWILATDSARLTLAVHAIGDRANDFVLSIFRESARELDRTHSFRIEHAQHLTAAAIPAFAACGVTPCMQPYHAIDDGRWAAKRLDSVRLSRTYAFKSLLDAGAPLSFGSDWPVAPLSPIQGIYAATTRRTLDGKNPGGWFPDQKITVSQALACYTASNALLAPRSMRTGILKKGWLADFTVLDRNIFEIKPEEIKEVRVISTYVGGHMEFPQEK